MTWRQKCAARVRKYGGRIEDDSVGDQKTFQVMAPAGHYWIKPGLHSCVVSYTYSPRWKQEIDNECWKDAYERIEGGAVRCEDPECEWCNP